MPLELNNDYILSRKEILYAVETLTQAFLNDPLYSYIIPDKKVRKDFMPHFFKFRVKYGMTYGQVHITSPKTEGIAIWIPYNNINMTPWKVLKCGGFSVFLKGGNSVMNKLSGLEKFASEIHQRQANFPHCYLSPIAVNPIFQGKGYGGALLKAGLNNIDKEHLPCFLETQSEKNVSIYERYGFKVVEETKIPGTNIPTWAMLRNKN